MPPRLALTSTTRQWQKKLSRVLDELPASQAEWTVLMTEVRWVSMLPCAARLPARRIQDVGSPSRADRHVTEEEHRKLDLARDLIGIPEAEAIAMLHAIVAEAEAFFGEPVEDD